jgi:adenylate cyclase
VLKYLVENAGSSKEELIKAVWPNLVVTDEAVTRCVSEVRSVLEDREQQIIRTVPRRGYVFAVPVSASAADQKTPSTGDKRRRLSIVVLPFADLTGDSEQPYLATAITEGLI